MRQFHQIVTQTKRAWRRAHCPRHVFACFCFTLFASGAQGQAQTKAKTAKPEPAEVLIGPLDHQRDVAEAPETQFYPAPEGFPDGILSYLLEPDSRTHRNEVVETSGGFYKRCDVVFRSFSQKTHHFVDSPSVLHLLIDNSNNITQAMVSPTGRYLMVREGFNAEVHTYPDTLFIWDMTASRLVRQYKDGGLFWPSTRWSPDERYLAFVRGGDREGYVSGAADMGQIDLTQSLRVLSVATGKTRDIGTGMGTLSFQWLPDLTLLYGECESIAGEPYCNRVSLNTSRIDASKSGSFHARKSASLATNVKRINEGAFFDTPAGAVSADGRLVAFFGWPDTKEAKRAKSSEEDAVATLGLGLYLFDRVHRTRRRLGNWRKGTLIWTSDGKLRLLSSNNADGTKLQSVSLAQYNQSSTLKLHRDAEALDVRLSYFELMGLTRNSRFLIVATNGQIENPNIVPGRGESNIINVSNIQVIDLMTGTLSKLATLPSAYALNWRETNAELIR